MSYSRKCVPVGQIVTLRAMFSDSCGNPINIDSGSVYIYNKSPDKSWTEIVDSKDFSGSLDTITSVTKLSDGFYEVTYTVPNEDVGSWNDLWVVEVNGVTLYNAFNFSVVSVGGVFLQSIPNNVLVKVATGVYFERT